MPRQGTLYGMQVSDKVSKTLVGLVMMTRTEDSMILQLATKCRLTTR